MFLEYIWISGYYHDMRIKISTLLEDSLFRRTKMESARQGKQISEVVAEALDLYLSQKGRSIAGTGAVSESWNVLPLAPRKIRRILDEEDGILSS